MALNKLKLLVLLVLTLITFSCETRFCGGEQENTNDDLRLKTSALITKIAHPVTGKFFQTLHFSSDLVDKFTGRVVGKLEKCRVGIKKLKDGTLRSEIISTFSFPGRESITTENVLLQIPNEGGFYTNIFEKPHKNSMDKTDYSEISNRNISLHEELDLV